MVFHQWFTRSAPTVWCIPMQIPLILVPTPSHWTRSARVLGGVEAEEAPEVHHVSQHPVC